jgi:succinoglycan biosynthesis protein ExoV
MQLYHWQGAVRNFGDALNLLLWPFLLPGFFNDDARELFLGIGSVLDARHPRDAVKLVAGAGYGGYQSLPVLDERWVIHWVRGPRTARYLGLDTDCGLGDPAMLLRHAGWQVAGGGCDIGFMPHFESAGRGAWREAASAAGLRLIDPRDEPAAIITAIGGCRLLLSEALHGVIVADTLRVPWVALEPQVPLHRAKWHDWADTVGLAVTFQRLAASSLLERLYCSHLAAYHTGRVLLEASEPTWRRLARRRFVAQAAQSLRLAVAAPPQLSAAVALDRCQTRMLERVERLRRSPPGRAIDMSGWDASALHRLHNSAYQARSVG